MAQSSKSCNSVRELKLTDNSKNGQVKMHELESSKYSLGLVQVRISNALPKKEVS